MNQMKRKISLSKHSNDTTKKLRLIINNEHCSISSLETLSNEVFYEIFDYLDGSDIYRAFSKLNTRFQQLITSPSLPLRISFDENSSSEIKHVCKNILLPHKNHIFSLHLRDSKVINDFFTQTIIDSSFTRLQSFSLGEILATQLMTILVGLKSLPHLSSLRIHVNNGHSKHFSDIYRMIFHLSSLKSSRFSVLTEEKLNIFIPFRKDEQFSSIERLVMSHICDLSELNSILRHTPRLKHLTCQSLIESNTNIDSDIPIILPHLTRVNIDNCQVKFDEFEKFVRKISSRLQILRIEDFHNRTFIYPQRWERLIYQFMPCLVTFELKCNLFMNQNRFGHLHFDSFDEQFTSRLWTVHGWKLTVEVKPDKISYFIYEQQTIHSTRQNINTSAMLFSSPHELSITNYTGISWQSSFIDRLHPILSLTKFTSLHLFWSGIPIGTFVKVLNQLPNLDSLKLSSSLLFLMENLDFNDRDKFRINNKITKVWLWMDMQHVTTLIELCPLMEHFEVDGVRDTELQSLVHFILTKTQTHTRYLHSLRLCTYNTNDRMVDEIQMMINRENLLSNYIIKRFDNAIALKWNLT